MRRAARRPPARRAARAGDELQDRRTKDAFEDADSFDLTVKDVTITGTSASAKLTAGTGSDEKDYTLEFARDGTAWKISSLR